MIDSDTRRMWDIINKIRKELNQVKKQVIRGTQNNSTSSTNINVQGSYGDTDVESYIAGVDNAAIARGDSALSVDVTDGAVKQDLISDLLALTVVADIADLDDELANLVTAEIDYLEALYATGVTSVEFGYLNNASSEIQAQIDAIDDHTKYADSDVESYLEGTGFDPSTRIFSGDEYIFNTGSAGTENPLYVARAGSKGQSLEVWTDDSNVNMRSIQDETGDDDKGGFIFWLDDTSLNPHFRIKVDSGATIFDLDEGGDLIIGDLNPGGLVDGRDVADDGTKLDTLDAELGNLSVAEIDYLEALYATGVTSTEYDYLDGVTSAIQTQLDAKQAQDTLLDQIAGLSDPGADRILFWDEVSSNQLAWLTVGDGLEIDGVELKTTGGPSYGDTDVEDYIAAVSNAGIATGDSLLFVDVTDGAVKQDLISDLLALQVVANIADLDNELANLIAAEIDYLEALYATGVTSVEFDYLDGVTSAIQTQIDALATQADYEATNAIGTDNAQWVTVQLDHRQISSNVSNVIDISASIGYQFDNAAADSLGFGLCPWAPTRNGLSLYLKSWKIQLLDADSNDYLDRILIYGHRSSSTTTLFIDQYGGNLTSAQTFEDDLGTDYDISAYRTVHFWLDFQLSTAKQLDYTSFQIQLYYA